MSEQQKYYELPEATADEEGFDFGDLGDETGAANPTTSNAEQYNAEPEAEDDDESASQVAYTSETVRGDGPVNAPRITEARHRKRGPVARAKAAATEARDAAVDAAKDRTLGAAGRGIRRAANAVDSMLPDVKEVRHPSTSSNTDASWVNKRPVRSDPADISSAMAFIAKQEAKNRTSTTEGHVGEAAVAAVVTEAPEAEKSLDDWADDALGLFSDKSRPDTEATDAEKTTATPVAPEAATPVVTPEPAAEPASPIPVRYRTSTVPARTSTEPVRVSGADPEADDTYAYLFRPGDKKAAPAATPKPPEDPSAAETTAPLDMDFDEMDIAALLDGDDGEADDGAEEATPVVTPETSPADPDGEPDEEDEESGLSRRERAATAARNGWTRAVGFFGRRNRAGESDPDEPDTERPRGRRRNRIIAAAVGSLLIGGLAFGLVGDEHEGPARGHVAAAAPAKPGHAPKTPGSIDTSVDSGKPRDNGSTGNTSTNKARTIHAGNEDLKISSDGTEVTITLDQGGTYWDGISQAEHAMHLNADNEHTDETVQSMHLKPGQDRKMAIGSHKTFVMKDGKLIAK